MSSLSKKDKLAIVNMKKKLMDGELSSRLFIAPKNMIEETKKDLCSQFLQIGKDLNVSQKDIAELAGMTVEQVNKIENYHFSEFSIDFLINGLIELINGLKENSINVPPMHSAIGFLGDGKLSVNESPESKERLELSAKSISEKIKKDLCRQVKELSGVLNLKREDVVFLTGATVDHVDKMLAGQTDDFTADFLVNTFSDLLDNLRKNSIDVPVKFITVGFCRDEEK